MAVVRHHNGDARPATGAIAAGDASLKRLHQMDWDFASANTTYLTHGLHPYPAKYIPQIPSALIEELSAPGETVADIFCGSGTTLVEALLHGRQAIGIDANPLACLISQAKTTLLQEEDVDALNAIAQQAQLLAAEVSIRGQGLFYSPEPYISAASRPIGTSINFWFESFVVEELAEILSWCRALPGEPGRTIALAAFSSIVVSVSKQDSDTRYVQRDKHLVPGDALRRFAKAITYATKAATAFTAAVQSDLRCQVLCADILTNPGIEEVDLVICSPPYPNAYSYHLYHMTRMLWLGMDQPTFKQQEIGSHRKYSNKGANGATIDTFRKEMALVFGWLHTYLRVNRYACFVIGDSKIRGQTVNNANLLSDVALEHGFSEVERIERRMQDGKKAFNPTIGRIKTEHILILQKRAGGC